MAGYLPRHDTQYEPRTIASPYDCNMAAAADAARFYSLGRVNRNHDQMRRYSGTYHEITNGIAGDEGTNIDEAARALAYVGVPSTVYTASAGRTFAHVMAALRAGYYVIAHGDYGSVPRAERGELAPTFTGLHSVGFARYVDGSGVQVGDGLSDAWEFWHSDDAERYMRDFPGGGFTYLTVKPRRVRGLGNAANVYPNASNNDPRIGTLGVSSRAHTSGLVLGETVMGKRSWYRIYRNGRIGYVHVTQVTPA